MRAALVLLFVLSATQFCFADSKADPHCTSGKGSFRANIRGYSVTIQRSPLAEGHVSGEILGCRAFVKGPEGQRLFSTADWGMTLYESEKDINGDGNPDLVFEAYTGGAHCCWTYWIVSPTDEPALLAYFENERGASFDDTDGDGRIEIWTTDGAFDYFDDLSHADTPFPTVVLELDGREFRNISSRFRASYEKEITQARRQLRRSGLTDIVVARDRSFGDYFVWKQSVLEIVFAYLYSGREHHAWKTIDKMWPADDRARIKKLIWECRSRGVL